MTKGKKTKEQSEEILNEELTQKERDIDNQEIDKKDETITKLTKEKEEFIALAQRLQADFDNYRKRNNSVREDAYNEGIADTVIKFLPVIDNTERAIQTETANGTTGQLFEGLVLIGKQLTDVLKSIDVMPIPASGEKFDPNLHEAIAAVEPAGGQESGIVCDELRKGYVCKDKVIRHSMVRVTN